jgi:hypothetical protein
MASPATIFKLTRVRAAAVAFAAAVLVVFAGGAARSHAATGCNLSGRLFCASVTDTDPVSATGVLTSGKKQVPVTGYVAYTVTVQTQDKSTLTNGTVKVTLTDSVNNVPNASGQSTASYISGASASFCSLTSTSPNLVTCSIGNFAAGAAPLSFRVVYQTSTTANATGTTATVQTTFKENTNDGQTTDPNPDTLTLNESTSYEPNPQGSISWAPPGNDVSLGTDPSDTTYSVFAFKNPAGKPGFLATLNEVDESSETADCAPGLKCVGQLVNASVAGADPGAFSKSNPLVLTIVLSTSITSLNENTVKVSHETAPGVFDPPISTKCAHDPPLSTDTMPCIIPNKDNQLKILTVRIYTPSNSQWRLGG